MYITLLLILQDVYFLLLKEKFDALMPNLILKVRVFSTFVSKCLNVLYVLLTLMPFLLYLQAEDLDSGAFGEITYSISNDLSATSSDLSSL